MKKNLLIATAIAFIGCKQETNIDYAIISGKIANKPVGEVSINSFDRAFTKTINFSEDGTFKDTIKVDIKSYVLYDGTNPIFLHLEAGNDLNISYDAQDFANSLSISGKGSEISNYLIAKRKNEQELFGSASETYILSEADFKTKLNDIKEANETLLSASKDLSTDYVSKEKKDIKYFYLLRLQDYEGAHKYFTKNDTFRVSDDFLREFEGFDYTSEEDYEFSRNYKSIVTNHFADKGKQLAVQDSITNDLAFVKTVTGVNSQSIKNGLLFEFANYNIGYSEDVKTFYEAFIANSTNEENNKIITDKYNKLTAVAKGRPSPKFVNYENYAGGTTSLDDLKGKYVYIDVWATWCGPCKREIPFLKEIEQKYHDKNIEFVSLSIDKVSDREKWKSMISEEALGGTQLLADNDWKSSFVKDYQINGIPRFILIDTEGNIVNPNAPRPSSPELVTLFSELNI